MTLAAAWLGSWKAPWPQTRGRRWGDRVWALQAMAQAWLLGGAEGRWPLATWEGRRPQGPRPMALPTAWAERPDPGWVATLRHGSPGIPADRPAQGEDPLSTQAWTALLAGDGAPWMALGTLLLDRPTRTRWLPLLGAVTQEGRLRLPPFLEGLVPSELHCLPPGWWAGLLGSLDGEGRLLPAGDVPLDLPWEALRPHLDGLVLHPLPPDLAPYQDAPWLHRCGELGWMIAPSVRAWGRGWGAALPALGALVPPSLAQGDAPGAALAAILEEAPELPDLPSEVWRAALLADQSGAPLTTLPPPCGEPTLDRIRTRWVPELPAPAPGYPAWGTGAHPCADPFHWMAEGTRAWRGQAFAEALQAFAWAHGHFDRLGAPGWAQRAAFNASLAAFMWADLPAHQAWAARRGPLPSPHRELEALRWLIFEGRERELPAALHALLRAHPAFEEAWSLRVHWAMREGSDPDVAACLPHLRRPQTLELARAFLQGLPGDPPESFSPEEILLWRFHQARRQGPLDAFWEAWEACPNHVLRLETGLDLLESRPETRTGARLLALQSIAVRAQAEAFLARLRSLWPAAQGATAPAVEAEALLRAGLASAAGTLWLQIPGQPLRGMGDPPPEGLVHRLQDEGSLAPLEVAGRLWWGVPLQWEGLSVGWALTASAPGEPPLLPWQAQALAPWAARLVPTQPAAIEAASGTLLADGSEPMATVLRDLRRVAPASLPVLILGPSGSGKELAARELHRLSGRSGPLVPVNCSELAETLLESELFGHVKGAFTGADRDRRGAIESASGGTLFLDEIADLTPRIQSMLLRVLQEREVRKVGSDRAARVDVRFVAATHRPLEAFARSGAFRSDLLFRLQGTVLRLPSLAERAHELPFLLPHLVAQVAQEQRRAAPDLAPGLSLALARLPWPGNFRELRYALERALLRCGEGPLKPAHFPELDVSDTAHRTWEEATRAFQRQLLLDTLRRTQFKAAEAATLLGLTRPALYTAAKRLGLDLLAERARELGP